MPDTRFSSRFRSATDYSRDAQNVELTKGTGRSPAALEASHPVVGYRNKPTLSEIEM